MSSRKLEFIPGKRLGTYFGDWECFINCQATFKNDVVTIKKTYDGYVDVFHHDSGELWEKVHPMSIIPLEIND